MRTLMLAALALLGTPAAAQEAPVPPLDRSIDLPIEVRLPVHHCSVPGALVAMSRLTKLTAGVEFLPSDCRPEWAREERPASSVQLQGLTVKQALDRLVELDPRYRWGEADGVIVLRPLAAWGDAADVLNTPLATFDVNQQHMGGALGVLVSQVLGRRRIGMATANLRTEEGNRAFSVHVTDTTVLGALNAIVRAHGAMWWEVQDHSYVVNGQPDRMVWLYTHDGSGLGSTTKTYRP
jgi:hypothetical protein